MIEYILAVALYGVSIGSAVTLLFVIALYFSIGFGNVHVTIIFVLSIITFSFVGYTSGFFVGNSRSPAVGSFVNALLPFFGGLFAVGFVRSNALRILTLCSVLSFSINLLVGGIIGATYRSSSEVAFNSLAAQRDRATIEFLVNRYRIALGLPPIDMKPIAESE